MTITLTSNRVARGGLRSELCIVPFIVLLSLSNRRGARVDLNVASIQFRKIRRVRSGWLFCVGEFVTDSPNGQHSLRIVGILFDFRAQAVDVRVDRSIITFIGIIPDFLEQVFARKYTARIRGKQFQQIEFLWS